MIVLAIMQNMWVRDPEGTVQYIERIRAKDGDAVALKYRRRLISYALFAGCKSGRVLKKVFGDLCTNIVWEEASPKIGGQASSAFPPDIDHIRATIEEVKPAIIIVFGEVARRGIALVDTKSPVIFAPHPAARHASAIAELEAAAKLLRMSLLP